MTDNQVIVLAGVMVFSASIIGVAISDGVTRIRERLTCIADRLVDLEEAIKRVR